MPLPTYQPRILTSADAYAQVRSLCLPLVPPARALALVPDATIASFGVLGRAESTVLARVASAADLAAILAGAAVPALYAGGNGAQAQALVIAAALSFTCAHLVPLLQQLIATQERTEIISVTRGIDWAATQQEYMRQGYESLGRLRPAAAWPSLSMAPAGASPFDPDSPTYGQGWPGTNAPIGRGRGWW